MCLIETEEPQCGRGRVGGRETQRPSQAAVEFGFYFVGDRTILKDLEQRKGRAVSSVINSSR